MLRSRGTIPHLHSRLRRLLSRNRSRPLLMVTDPFATLAAAAEYRHPHTETAHHVVESYRDRPSAVVAEIVACPGQQARLRPIPSRQAQYHGPSRRHQAAKTYFATRLTLAFQPASAHTMRSSNCLGAVPPLWRQSNLAPETQKRRQAAPICLLDQSTDKSASLTPPCQRNRARWHDRRTSRETSILLAGTLAK